MANHHAEPGKPMHSSLDALNWPVLGVSVLAWPTWPWASWLWEHLPTATAFYMAVSAAFMLFQMSDKMGWIDRFKRKPKTD